MNTKLLFIVPMVLILVGLGVWAYQMPLQSEGETPGGNATTTNTYTNAYTNLIQVDAPSANAVISSPLTVTGKARGTWYFEASFPVRLIDANGNELAVVPAQAQDDWMTENFVPFKAVVIFPPSPTKTGTLILHNDNPSGLPENDKEVRIPVQFSDAQTVVPAEFRTSVTMRVGDQVSFPDGMLLIMKQLNDSRCKAGVQCVWQGELAAVFTALRGSFGVSSEEVRLGMVTQKNVTVRGYAISLQSATETTATIIVSVVTPITGSGGITGYVHMGPTCPVERTPPDPKCADKPYALARVEVRTKTSGVLASSMNSDEKGNFRVNVVPGVYSIVAKPQNGSLPRCNEVEATVTANKVTKVDISCDTGIR